jgi:O-antigen ligase
MIAAAVVGVWAWHGGRIRAIWLIGGATPLLIIAMLFLVSVRTNEPRLEFYRQALDYLAAQPLTGNGLFTSKYYERLLNRPGFVLLHVHAHNAPLHVAAELGMLGIAALGVTTALTMRGALINWRHAQSTEKTLRAGALAALAGFGAHHMVDFPVITPAVAVTLIMVLIIALLPDAPQARQRGQALQTLLIGVLWLSLVTIGQINLATVWEGVRNAVNRGIP